MRMIFVLVAYLDFYLFQLDVKTVFLNGVITEDIYMVQSEGYEIKGKEYMVLKFNRGIYGFK